MRFAFFIFVASAAWASDQAHMEYHDDFASYYSTIQKEEYKFQKEVPLLKEETIVSPLRVAIVRIRQTNPQKIPYEKEEASIVVQEPNGGFHYLHVQNFKGISLRWIDERLLLIERWIGRIGHITEIYDTEKRRWLYRQGETYIEPPAPANASEPRR